MKSNLSNQPIELQHYLLNRRRTQKEIAEHFGVDRKTVRRAIDKLGQFAMVSEEREGRNTVYFISESDFNSSQMTPIELAALILAQEAIAAGGNFFDERFPGFAFCRSREISRRKSALEDAAECAAQSRRIIEYPRHVGRAE